MVAGAPSCSVSGSPSVGADEATAGVDGLGTVGGVLRSARQLGGLGKNFKLNRTKGAPTLEGGEEVKGEVSPPAE